VPDKNPDKSEDSAPKLSFASALGEAGHEVADLGLENVPDSGPLLHDAGAAGISEDQIPDDVGAWTLGGVGPEVAERENSAGSDDDQRQ